MYRIVRGCGPPPLMGQSYSHVGNNGQLRAFWQLHRRPGNGTEHWRNIFSAVEKRKLFLFKIAHSQNRREYISTENWIIWILCPCSWRKITECIDACNSPTGTPATHRSKLYLFPMLVGSIKVYCVFKGLTLPTRPHPVLRMQLNKYYYPTKLPQYSIFITQFHFAITVTISYQK